mgnify:CR=1 FL=1|jgi:hypothetical protein
MLTTYGAMIKLDIIESFDKAVANSDNHHEGGGINWNFVDADVSIEMGVFYNSDYLYDCIKVLVDAYYDKVAA